MRTDKAFRVAHTTAAPDDEGGAAHPPYDLSALRDDPRVDLVTLPDHRRILGPEVEAVDAVVGLFGRTRITAESLHPGGRLALIARLGVGHENIDLEACTENGVAVALAPDAVVRPTAVAALTLMLAVTTRLFEKHALTKLGSEGWVRLRDHDGFGLRGRVLGIIGFGRIGQELARLVAPLDMTVVAHDPYVAPALAEELGVALLDLDDLLRTADVVSLHCKLTPETRELIDARRLALMKPGAFLVNAARGGVVDAAALLDALRSGGLAGAGLDVFAREPTAPDDPLLQLDNVVLSGHALAHSDQLWADMGRSNVAAVHALLAGRAPAHLANPEVLGSDIWRRRIARIREMAAP